YIAGQSPAVRTAFFYMADLYEVGAIGPFENFSEEWFAAMEAGGFATMACPAWMTGVIKDGSGPGNAGNWDIAPLPGVAGNWGGSWLGVTKDSDHPEEAAKLVDYLTSPEGQLAAWKAINNYPSSPKAQQDPSVSELTDDYFNGAPVGQIIADSIAAYKPVYFGALHSAARTAMENVLIAMIQGEYRSADEAFDAFIAAGQEVVGLEGCAGPAAARPRRHTAGRPAPRGPARGGPAGHSPPTRESTHDWQTRGATTPRARRAGGGDTGGAPAALPAGPAGHQGVAVPVRLA